MVTCTPGRTAPDSSVTLPKISPVWFWASAGALTPSTSASTASKAVKRTLIWSSVKKANTRGNGLTGALNVPCMHARFSRRWRELVTTASREGRTTYVTNCGTNGNPEEEP